MSDDVQAPLTGAPVKLPAPQLVSVRFRCHCGHALQLASAGKTMSATCVCGRVWGVEETVGTIHEREWLSDGRVRRHFRMRVDVRSDGPDSPDSG